ncbi:hypothetical protein ACFTQ7_23080 [Lysinibacillus sp. NPDC056959]|uniref:hypothetical protein n=1 Tax=Lysinibacillus sp. NPDC056959 TaxID=3345981 RepID=UPI003641C26E
MVKEAFSLELQDKISADLAHNKSLIGKLKDPRAFECTDTKCKIQLTCTKWQEKDGKRIYFTPSSRESLHIAGCKASGEEEEVQLSTFEKEEAKNSVIKNGIIVLKKISDQSKKKDASSTLNETKNDTTYTTQSGNNTNKAKRSERSNITSIMTLINLLNDPSFDKDKPFIQLPENEKISLNELFVSVDDVTLIQKDKIRVFYGKVKVSTYKDTALKIDFVNSSNLPFLFTNKKLMLDRHYGKQAKKCVDKDKEIYVFFRGYLSSDNKWKPYNEEFFKDLYFSLEKGI